MRVLQLSALEQWALSDIIVRIQSAALNVSS